MAHIERVFPGLKTTPYEITSPWNPFYNCIAWAAGETGRRWWPGEPDYFWPGETSAEGTVEAFEQAFATLGYRRAADGSFNPSREKIALYCDDSGNPTHAARQLPDGRWSSKLGDREDIAHELEGLSGDAYGHVRAFLERPRA